MKNVLIDILVIGNTLAIIQLCRKLDIMVEELIFVYTMIKVFYEFDPTFNRRFGGSFIYLLFRSITYKL